MITEVYDITGMHCAACSSAVERVTRKLPGVSESQVNLTMARLTITYDESLTTSAMICEKVAKAGFGATLHSDMPKQKTKEDEDDEERKKSKKKLISLIISCFFAGLLLFVAMGNMMIKDFPLPSIISPEQNPQNFALLQFLLALPVLILGKDYYTSGFSSLLHGNPNMNTLVALSSVASLVYSLVLTFMISSDAHLVHELYFESSAVVIALVSVGKYLESRSEAKTKSALKKLIKLSPDTAALLNGNEVVIVPTSTVTVGQTLLVKAGEQIPLDGVVTKGFGSANEAMLTGESVPVAKEEGSAVIGGSILQNGALYIKVTKVGSETMLAQIIKFVEDAQGKKAPISKTADKVAGVFVPIVIAVSLIVGIIWFFVLKDIGFALRIFTSVLVIACPCAMGLATPTAIMVGTGLGASHGILIRSGEALEILHSVNVAVFDKTGTITEGKMKLCDVVCADGVDEDELLTLIYSLEALSDHPIAAAIDSAAKEKGLSPLEVSTIDNIPGFGLCGEIDGRGRLIVGNEKLMQKYEIDISAFAPKADACASDGKTLLFVALENRFVGFATVSDTIKDGVAQTVAELGRMGIRTVLLTGDNEAAARCIANKAGIGEVISNVLPTEKADVVSRLQEDGSVVMMVGDGINDAPALTSANVGVAVGGGSDIAIDSAGIVLMRDDPADICSAVRLGRYTIRNIKQNLFWAFCYNVLAIPVAAGALFIPFGITLTPMIGSLAMSLSSLFVVTNALRLGRKKI